MILLGLVLITNSSNRLISEIDKINRLYFAVNWKDHESCRNQLLVVVSKTEIVMMMMMMMMMIVQYTNCVVKAHKVQTVKLTPYKYKS